MDEELFLNVLRTAANEIGQRASRLMQELASRSLNLVLLRGRICETTKMRSEPGGSVACRSRITLHSGGSVKIAILGESGVAFGRECFEGDEILIEGTLVGVNGTKDESIVLVGLWKKV